MVPPTFLESTSGQTLNCSLKCLPPVLLDRLQLHAWSRLQSDVTSTDSQFSIAFSSSSTPGIRHYEQLPGRSCTRVLDQDTPELDIPARRNLRSSSQVQLLVPRYRKKRSGRRGFSVSAPQLWNVLPADIRLGVNRIDSCNFELCSQGPLWITINSTVFKDGLGNYVK